jgi:hypothetical protein
MEWDGKEGVKILAIEGIILSGNHVVTICFIICSLRLLPLRCGGDCGLVQYFGPGPRGALRPF